MSRSPVNTVRFAIYTRKSTQKGLEQEFNSLDANVDAAGTTSPAWNAGC